MAASLLDHDCIFERAANDSFKSNFKRGHAVAVFADAPHVGSAELLDHFHVSKDAWDTSSGHNIEIQHQNIITINHQLLPINGSDPIPKLIDLLLNKITDLRNTLNHFKWAFILGIVLNLGQMDDSLGKGQELYALLQDLV